MPKGLVTISFKDFSKETATWSYNIVGLTAANIVAQEALILTLRNATRGITLGAIEEESVYLRKTNVGDPLPASMFAQRESKWVVTYMDSSPTLPGGSENFGFGKKFTTEIPTADIDGRLLPESDTADLANVQIAAWVDAFQDVAISPYGGSALVQEIVFSGSRS